MVGSGRCRWERNRSKVDAVDASAISKLAGVEEIGRGYIFCDVFIRACVSVVSKCVTIGVLINCLQLPSG